MAHAFETTWYVDQIPENAVYFLAGDIGGTNSNFGIMDYTDPEAPRLLVSLHAKSQHITDYPKLVADLCAYVYKYYQIALKKACFGVAGIINERTMSVSPTNLSITLNAQDIKAASGLETVRFINDFEAVAVGIDYIAPDDVALINEGKQLMYGNKACLGAGTGLGQAAMLWHHTYKRYLPVASEGGHSDFASHTEFDLALTYFIKEQRGEACPVSWEEVLAGRGIKWLYQYLETQKRYPRTEITQIIEESGFAPDKISQYAQDDERSYDTFLWYVNYYARCAKNVALEMLALNGIYIGGGIAAKNLPLFQHQLFMESFTQCGVHSHLLADIPVYVITDYNVSLYGAAGFMTLYENGYI